MGIAFNQVQLHILEIPDGWVPKPSWTASIQVWWGIYILINKHAEDGMLVRKGYQHVNNAIIDFLPSHNQHQLSYYIRLDPPFNTLKSYLCCYSAKWYMVVWDCPMGVDNVCQDAIPRTFKCGLCVYVCVCVCACVCVFQWRTNNDKSKRVCEWVSEWVYFNLEW